MIIERNDGDDDDDLRYNHSSLECIVSQSCPRKYPLTPSCKPYHDDDDDDGNDDDDDDDEDDNDDDDDAHLLGHIDLLLGAERHNLLLANLGRHLNTSIINFFIIISIIIIFTVIIIIIFTIIILISSILIKSIISNIIIIFTCLHSPSRVTGLQDSCSTSSVTS